MQLLLTYRAAPHLHVRVFERARKLLPLGYLVAIAPNGQSCLKV
jgi:hypothetical protein